MGWIYLAASGVLPTGLPDTSGPSSIVSKSDTLKVCSLQEWLQENCQEHQSGMMSEHSQEQCFPQASTSSMADFPVRTCPKPESDWETGMDLTATDPGYFSRSSDWLMKYDRDTSSWRMFQQSLPMGLTELLPSLPNAGTMLDGYVYPLRQSEHVTYGIGGGLLPTPMASGHIRDSGENGGVGLEAMLRRQVKKDMLPTPTARDYKESKPTGNVEDNHILGRAVHKLPTPQARDHRSGSRDRYEDPTKVNNLNDFYHGQLNPRFVEEMMGYPTGYTELNVLGIQWYRSAPGKRLSTFLVSRKHQKKEADYGQQSSDEKEEPEGDFTLR